MDYDVLINNAIKKGEVVKLLQGEPEYEVEISKFTSDVFPTDINAVLVNCFYKQKENIENIDEIFFDTINRMILGSAKDIYIATLYFDACIFQEEIKKATFYMDKEKLSIKLQEGIKNHKDKLKNDITFSNGMTKHNPLKNIENFNKYYVKKYGLNIL